MERDRVTRDMRRLLRLINILREQDPRMELSQVATLLNVLTRPGISASDLCEILGLSKSALSRNVLALSSRSYLPDENDADKFRAGLGLITQITDPSDGRYKLLSPTRPGRVLAEKLSAALNEEE